MIYRCECRDGCACQTDPGPAAFEVTRPEPDGKGAQVLKVCTRCHLTGDEDETLLVTEEDPIAPFLEHDPLGVFAILSYLDSTECPEN